MQKTTRIVPTIMVEQERMRASKSSIRTFDEVASAHSSDFSVGSVNSSTFLSNHHEEKGRGGAHRGSGTLSKSGVVVVRKPSKTTEAAAANRLSELTVNKLQFLKLGRLYGRGNECRQLQEAWDDVRRATAAKEGSAEPRAPPVRRLLTIRGASGTGKSSLVETLRPGVLREGGFYLQGKFPQQQQQRHSRQSQTEPYAAFASACSDLCDLVVSLDDDEMSSGSSDGIKDCAANATRRRSYHNFKISEFRERLQREIGADAPVLTRVIPALIPILQPDSIASEELTGLEAHNQFKYTFRRFLRAVTSFGPVVLVLDDVQWADAASMELLEALLSDRECRAVLSVACYRDDDCYSDLVHHKTFESLQTLSTHDTNLKVDAISIASLTVEQINELLVDLLSSTDTETFGLAECVHKKTLGNVFFVIQFLTVLQDVVLLQYNIGALKWTWDLDAIYLRMAATDNVVNLMKDKMNSLPASITRVLPMMACLGSSFSMSAFELVVDHIASTVDCEPGSEEQDRSAVQLLSRCESEGLIEHCGGETHQTFMWVHDKIQEAAFSLIRDDELQALKLQLGKILYEGLDSIALERHLFIVANLLNTDHKDELSLPIQKPIDVATLFLRAGTKASETSAFELAAAYLTAGIDLLPPDHWESEYVLSLDLYCTAAEAEYCAGNFEKLRCHCQQVIQQEHRPFLDKQRVYNVLVDATAAGEGPSEAITLCMSIMSRLGCDFPKQALKLHARRAFGQLKKTLQKYSTVDTILQLPAMGDKSKLWVCSLLNRIVTYAYLCKSELLPLYILRWLHLTINGGVNSNTPVVFVMGGFAIAAYLQDYQRGVALADLSLELVPRMKSPRKVESRVVEVCHSVVLHWLRPIKLSVKPLLTNYSLSMAVGDTEMAGWGMFFCLEYSFLTGTSLQDMKADLEFYTEQLRCVKQLGPVEVVKCIWQSVLHLTDDNPFDGCLSGDVMRQNLEQKSFEHHRAVIQQYQMYLAFVFGKYSLVYEILRNANMEKGYFDEAFHGLNALCHVYATSCLSMVSRFRETNDKKYLTLAKKLASKVKSWALASVRENGCHLCRCYDEHCLTRCAVSLQIESQRRTL